MKVKFEEIYWAHNYMTGAHIEKVVATSEVEAAVGAVPDFGTHGKGIKIDAVEDGSVTITFPERSESGQNTVTVHIGESYIHNPYSRSGYKYCVEVIY